MYHFTCVCGKPMQSQKLREGICPKCGRPFVLKWQADYQPPPEPKQVKL